MVKPVNTSDRGVLAGILLVVAPCLGCGDVDQDPPPPQTEDADPPEAEDEPGAAEDEDEPSVAEDEPAPGIAGFSWVAPHLAGLPKPGSRGALSQDLRFLADEGVDVLVSLTPTPVAEDSVREQGMRPEHIPVPDFTAPTPEQIDRFIELAAGAQAEGLKVAVHCLAGHGRTGTVLATWFIHEGQTAEQALATIRELRPGSVETSGQEEALAAYEQRIRGEDPHRDEAPAGP